MHPAFSEGRRNQSQSVYISRKLSFHRLQAFHASGRWQAVNQQHHSIARYLFVRWVYHKTADPTPSLLDTCSSSGWLTRIGFSLTKYGSFHESTWMCVLDLINKRLFRNRNFDRSWFRSSVSIISAQLTIGLAFPFKFNYCPTSSLPLSPQPSPCALYETARCTLLMYSFYLHLSSLTQPGCTSDRIWTGQGEFFSDKEEWAVLRRHLD